MRYLNEFRKGFKFYGEATKLMFKKPLIWYFLFPMVINIILFVVGMKFINSLSESTFIYFNELLNLQDITILGTKFLFKFISGFISFFFKVLFFLIFAYFSGYIILIILSPVFSYLSEKAEKLKTGKDYKFSFKQLLIDIWRGTRIAVRNLFIEIILTIILFIVSFVPVIGWISAIILFFITAYFYGFSFLDYALERRKMSVRESIIFMRKNKGLVIANGTLFSLVLIIPFCGVILAGFISLISVVAGTLSVLEILDTDNKKIKLK